MQATVPTPRPQPAHHPTPPPLACSAPPPTALLSSNSPPPSRPPPRASSLAFNNLEGKLPQQWGRLERLEVLKINSNKLSGPVPKDWAPPSKPHMAKLETLTLFGNAELSGCLPASLGAKGPSSKGFFQAPSGELTASAKQAAAGTKITGFC